jgi:hypothetical protein
MTTSAALIGGALGSGFESKDDILRAAYGQRERHRRLSTKANNPALPEAFAGQNRHPHTRRQLCSIRPEESLSGRTRPTRAPPVRRDHCPLKTLSSKTVRRLPLRSHYCTGHSRLGYSPGGPSVCLVDAAIPQCH